MNIESRKETEPQVPVPTVYLEGPVFDDISNSHNTLVQHMTIARAKGEDWFKPVGLAASMIMQPTALFRFGEISRYVRDLQAFTASQKQMQKEISKNMGRGITYPLSVGTIGVSGTKLEQYVSCNHYSDCIAVMILDPINNGVAQVHISPRVFPNKIAPAEFHTIPVYNQHWDIDIVTRLYDLLQPEVCNNDDDVRWQIFMRASEDPSFFAHLIELVGSQDKSHLQFYTVGGNPHAQQYIEQLLLRGGRTRHKNASLDVTLPSMATEVRNVNVGNRKREIFSSPHDIVIEEEADPRHRLFRLPTKVWSVDEIKKENPYMQISAGKPLSG